VFEPPPFVYLFPPVFVFCVDFHRFLSLKEGVGLPADACPFFFSGLPFGYFNRVDSPPLGHPFAKHFTPPPSPLFFFHLLGPFREMVLTGRPILNLPPWPLFSFLPPPPPFPHRDLETFFFYYPVHLRGGAGPGLFLFFTVLRFYSFTPPPPSMCTVGIITSATFSN